MGETLPVPVGAYIHGPTPLPHVYLSVPVTPRTVTTDVEHVVGSTIVWGYGGRRRSNSAYCSFLLMPRWFNGSLST